MNLPGPEARIAAQEDLTVLLHAQIKQLSLDMQANFTEVKQLLKDKTSFEEVDFTLKAVATKEDLKILATKNDISALKGDISKLDTRIGQIETTQQRQEQLLQAILDRLPPRGE